MVWSLENVGNIIPFGYTTLGTIPISASTYAVALIGYSDFLPQYYGLLQTWSAESIDSISRQGIYQDLTVTVWSPVTAKGNLDGFAGGQIALFYAGKESVIRQPTPFEFWAFLV